MAEDRTTGSVSPRRAIALGIGLMLLSWGMAAGLDAFYEQNAFLKQLLHPAVGELVLRLLFLAIQLGFILYIARIIARYRQQGALLRAALQTAEAEKLRSQEILESVGDAISMQDLDFKIIYQNQAHKELLGDHVGDHCYHGYQRQESTCPECHLAKSFLDGKSHRREASAQTSRGLMHTEIISTPLRDASGKIVAGIESVRDITDRKLAEEEIRRINRELELRTVELAEANRELESFSYSLSHDLRSYITRISTADQLLQASWTESQEAKYLAQVIGDSCSGMEELIESMLSLSLLSRQEMRWEEVSLSEMAEEAVLQLRRHEPERPLEAVITAGLSVRGDRHLLKVVLENLIGNAWKYTSEANPAQIEFGVEERSGRRCFFVRDNGVGFDMSERDKLFVPFQRLQSAQGVPGSGVGLATVQRAIKRHGGEVWGEGEPGRGATFYFTIGEQAGSDGD